MNRIVKMIIPTVLCLLFLTSCDNPIANFISGYLPIEANPADTKLHNAIESDNYDLAIEAVDDGANITEIHERTLLTKWTYSPVKEAIKHRNWHIVTYLLDEGSDPDYSNGQGITLLMYSVGTPQNGITYSDVFDSENTLMLLDYGADVNKIGMKNYSALDCAILFGGRKDSQDILLANGAKITKETVDAQQLVIKNVKGILTKKETPHITRDIIFSTAKEVFSKAKKQGIEINIDPILESIIMEDTELTNKLLMETKVDDPDIILSFVSAIGQVSTMQLLEDKGYIPETSSEAQADLQITAATYGNLELVKYFAKKGLGKNLNEAGFSLALDAAVLNNP
jgi:ankyrin repeat protein